MINYKKILLVIVICIISLGHIGNSYLYATDIEGGLSLKKMVVALKPDKNPAQMITEKRNLSELISASGEENTRLSKYSFEYFITYTPDSNGNTSSMRTKGGKNPYFTIFSCGCNERKDKCTTQSNIIVPLEAVVTLIK